MTYQGQNNQTNTSDITSKLEGKSLSEMLQLWRETAESEMRINKKLGLNEVENFSLGLRYNFKSEKMQDLKDKPLDRVIQSAMALKMKDEIHHHYDLRKRREILKKRLAEKYHPRTHAYKKPSNT